MLSVTCCNFTYLPNNSMCILPTFVRTFLIISVILDQDPYVWFRRDTERRSQMFKELEKLLKELQNPEASLDLILTEQLQTKHVCWGHCLLLDLTHKTAKWAYREKIPGGFYAVRYQFYKATRCSLYKQLSSTTNYRPRMLWVSYVLQQRGAVRRGPKIKK